MRDNPFKQAKCYLGYSKSPEIVWSRNISYYFFQYLLQGYETPIDLFDKADRDSGFFEPDPLPLGPMTVQKAYATFSEVKGKSTGKPANPDPHDYTGTPISDSQDCELILKCNSDEAIYFPMPPTIIVTKHKK